MAVLVLYGSSVADATLTNACDMALNTTGGTETSKTTTSSGSGNYAEVLSHGGSVSDNASLPAPTGHGWVYSPGAGSFANATWSASIAFGDAAYANSTLVVRFYKYSGGSYTSIGSIVGPSLTSNSRTVYSFTATTMPATTFIAGDLLYVDLFLNDTTGAGGDNPVIYVSTSATTGVANDMQITTSTFTASGGTTSKDLKTRIKLAAINTRDLGARLLLQFGTTSRGFLATRLRLSGLGGGNLSTRLVFSPPLGSFQNDLAINKQQIVQVFGPNGNFIDVWRDAPLLAGFKEAINAATTPLRIQLPRSFDNYDLAGQPGSRGTIAQGNIVQYTIFGPGLPATGKIRYQGIIDAFQPQISESGEESLLVTLTPQSSVIADHGTIGGKVFGQNGIPSSYVDPIVMFDWWFNNIDPVTGYTYAYPLKTYSLNPSTSGLTFSYAFFHENLQDIFTTVLQMLGPNWFFRINPDLSVTLAQTPTIPQHTFVIGQHITAPTYKQDWTQLKNVVHYMGASTDSPTTEGLALTGIIASPAGGSHLMVTAKGSDVATFGERLIFSSDTRVIDQPTLQQLANSQLAVLDQMQLRTTIRLIDYRGDTRSTIGYDIESLAVGDSCTIIDPTYAPISTHATVYWDVAQWNVDYWTYIQNSVLNQTTTIAALTYNFDYVDVELANLQPNQSAQLGRIQQRFSDFTMI